MKTFVKRSWIFIPVWVLLIAAALLTMPDLGKLVREKGQVVIGDQYSYTIGKNIIKKMYQDNPDPDKQLEVALIYRDPKGLSDADKTKIKVRLDVLEQLKDQYHVVNIKNALSNKDMEGMLLSDDGTTLLVPVMINEAGRSAEDIRSWLQESMKVDGIEFYTTGADFVTEDFIRTTETGIAQTELITVIFIVLVLLIIFRSPVTPVVVLSSVGMSFIVALNVVLQLVGWIDFPLSSFTKVFLILILFGIGTDYSLLLLMRYKEELAGGVEKGQAIINSFTTAGKTVLFSSLTILIGFISLFFVEFGTYRSGSGVGVGVVVLIFCLFTFMPAMMYLLGDKLFWSPFHTKGHAESKGWRRVASISVKYPYLTIFVTLAVCALTFFYTNNLSFNNLREVGTKYPSIIGNNVATQEFGNGFVLPVTIAIENPDRMDTQEYLGEIDKLTNVVKNIKGVKEVHSVTQPKGEVFDELYLNDQSNRLDNGLEDAQSGLGEIHSGLNEAIEKIQSADYQKDSIQELQDGTDSLISAISKVTDGNEDLYNGAKDAVGGADQIEDGLGEVNTNLATLETKVAGMQTLYGQVADGYKTIDQKLTGINGSLSGIKTGMDGLVTMQGGLAMYPYDVNHDGTVDATETLGSDPLFYQMSQTTTTLDGGLGQVVGGLGQLEAGLAGNNANLVKLNAGLAQAEAGITAIKDGTTRLQSGSGDLKDGLKTIKNGQATLLDAMTKIEDGAHQLKAGQGKLIDGISTIEDNLNKLQNGLGDADTGVEKISTGLVQATDYLHGLTGSGVSQKTFYIPAEEIHGDLFPRSMNIFFSKNYKVTELILVLDVDPYSVEGMNVVKNIHQTFGAAIKDTKLSNANWGMSGITQMNVDLQTMSNNAFDFARIVMIGGIFIVLLFITRDLWMTVFVSISLVASYFIAVSLSALFFQHVVGIPELSWNVPFFSFIMVVSLGVDYSIFLIMRQKERPDLTPSQSVVDAAAKVGSVILSAGLILSGTFAAMYPSGVNTLMEISVTVIIGIMLLCLVFIPVFIPTMISFQAMLEGRRAEKAQAEK